MVQDGLGVLLAKLLGLHPFLGLVAGSITLVGGHGTGAAYVEKFGEASAIPGVMALTMTSATLGLVLGGVIGGPVAERLIRRHRLSAVAANGADSDVIMGPAETPVTTVPLVGSLAAALVAVLIGQWLGRLLADAPVTVPDFLLSLLAGLVLRNAGELVGLRLHDAAPDLIGSVCLSLFLAWTMMALDLGTVFGLAGPLLIILAAQVVLVALGVPGYVPRGRTGLRERGDGGGVLRLRYGRHGDGDRQHAGARAPPRSAATVRRRRPSSSSRSSAPSSSTSSMRSC
jgi:ESS family glutamate:Na+ symporter